MVVFTKREANRLSDLLYNYTTEKKDDEVFKAIENMKEFFTTQGKLAHVDLLESYFRDYSKLSKDWSQGGVLKYVCDEIVSCSQTSGYDYMEDIINRFGVELSRLNYF